MHITSIMNTCLTKHILMREIGKNWHVNYKQLHNDPRGLNNYSYGAKPYIKMGQFNSEFHANSDCYLIIAISMKL